jgi:C4-dicarboxylate transporter, DctQ subunit
MRAALRAFDRLVHAAASAGLAVSGVALFAGAVIVLAQVVIRYGELGATSFGDELSGYVLALSAFIAAADAFRSGALPRLVILADRLNGRARAAAELLSLASAVVVCSVLVVQAWGLCAESWRYGATSILLEIPLWLPQAAMLLGIVGLWAAVVVSILGWVASR